MACTGREGASGRRLNLLGDARRQRGWSVQPRAARRVLGLVVVPLAVVANLPDDGGLEPGWIVAEHAHLDLLSTEKLLDEDLRVVRQGEVECSLQRSGVGHLADADAGAEAGRLDEDGIPERGGDVRVGRSPIGFGEDQEVAGDIDPLATQDHLADVLVHRRGRAEHARADVRDGEHLEQALDRAVLTERAVQRREDDIAAERSALTGRERHDRAVGSGPDALARDGDAHGVEARRVEARGNAVGRAQRHLVLRGATATEHGNPQPLGH